MLGHKRPSADKFEAAEAVCYPQDASTLRGHNQPKRAASPFSVPRRITAPESEIDFRRSLRGDNQHEKSTSRTKDAPKGQGSSGA